LFVRQRLSSEPDRYRGRRRVPTPPRSRYAVVGLSAFVGAGVVALGAASNFPDAKAVSPNVLRNLQHDADTAQALSERAQPGPATRGEFRNTVKSGSETDAEDIWLLPMDDYAFTSPYGIRWGKLHAGIDLSAPEGSPYKAVHAGVVTQAGYMGGYGYAITVRQANNVEVIYAHSRRLFVSVGDEVTAGQVIGQVGNTGYSYGTHLHLEVHVNGDPTDPISYLRDVGGVDIKLQVQSVFAETANAS
jgi:murein DD-endopeptidase MepM/ murein hydrolase activator NlpD